MRHKCATAGVSGPVVGACEAVPCAGWARASLCLWRDWRSPLPKKPGPHQALPGRSLLVGEAVRQWALESRVEAGRYSGQGTRGAKDRQGSTVVLPPGTGATGTNR